MWLIFSTQKLQTLRCCRFGPRGPPPLDSLCGRGLFDPINCSYCSLKRNVVGVDVARDVVAAVNVIGVGRRGSAARRHARARCAAGAAGLEELDVVGDDLGGASLLAVL